VRCHGLLEDIVFYMIEHPHVKPLTSHQEAVLRAWKNHPGATAKDVALEVGMKPRAFQCTLQRAFARQGLTHFTAGFRRGDRPHVIRPLSLSGLGGV
jgi:hypothetical protein